MLAARSGRVDADVKSTSRANGSDANRTQVRTKVYVTIYENFGAKRERINKQTITLSNSKEKRELATVTVKKK